MRTIVFLLLAFYWVPITAHCKFESLPGLEFLQCASDTPDADGHGDCSNTRCCAIENSVYKASQHRVALPSPLLLPFSAISLLTWADVLPEGPRAANPEGPPEFAGPWQFQLRAAPSPRAPSFAS